MFSFCSVSLCLTFLVVESRIESLTQAIDDLTLVHNREPPAVIAWRDDLIRRVRDIHASTQLVSDNLESLRLRVDGLRGADRRPRVVREAEPRIVARGRGGGVRGASVGRRGRRFGHE